MYQPTHYELVKRGGIWLTNRKRCGAVILEKNNPLGGEAPDIIGWCNFFSILIEVKISRADFFADQKKHFRRNLFMGMGKHRYYLCPKDLIHPEELPSKWGLLYATTGQIREIVKPEVIEQDEFAINQEIALLVKIIRNVKWGVIVVPPNYEL